MSKHEPRNGHQRIRQQFLLDPKVQFAYLMREWRLMFRRETIAADFVAAIAVALVAVPLSLAIANASGVKPEVGLVTAIVGGIVVALLGGCRLQVSGPAAAMTFLVYEIISKYGFDGLIIATLLAGVFQIATGAFRLGRVMQFMPRPVVAGFLSGIGLTILCTQLPKVLGYDVTHDEEGGALGLLIQTVRSIRLTDWRALVVGATSASLMLLLPRISRRIPTPLVAVATASALPWILGWAAPETGIKLLGSLPRSFPPPTIPSVPWNEINELFVAAITIYVLASIESLLSAAVVDSMSRASRVDNDQELVGQGVANIASAMFGGIPVTGVIARSGTNIQAGARTRLSAIVHALIILLMMLALADLVGQIPIAALAGVLIAVALRMIETKLLLVLWRGSRVEAAIFLVTTGTILLTDLIVGVPVGLAAAFLYVVHEMSTLRVNPVDVESTLSEGVENGGPRHAKVIEVEGPLFFASSYHLRNVINQIGDGNRLVIFDLAHVPFLDLTGAELLEEIVDQLHGRNTAVILARPNAAVRERIETLAGSFFERLRSCLVTDTLPEAMAYAAQSEAAAKPDSAIASEAGFQR